MDSQKQQPSNTGLYIAIIGLIGTIVASVVGYLSIRAPIELPIAATQTAEARNTFLAHSVTPATLVIQTVPSVITATRISEQPNAIPSPATATPTPTQLPPSTTATPTRGAELLVDGFENYSNSYFQDNFKPNRNAGNNLNLYFVGMPHVSQGTQALAFEYNIRNAPPQHYVGFDRNLPIQDWSKYSKLCVWVESDGSNRNFIIQFGANNNNFRKSNFPLSIGGATDYCVPLNTQPSIDLRLIAYYGIYVEGPPQGQSVIYIDNVRLLP